MSIDLGTELEIYFQLQYNINLPKLERYANQVSEYFSHSKARSNKNPDFICEFSKYMLKSYYSNHYWDKAERLYRDESLKSI